MLTRVSARTVAVAGLALAAAGYALAARWPQPAGMVTGLSIAALGIGATFVTAFTASLTDAAPAEGGLRPALVNTFHELGGAVSRPADQGVIGSSRHRLRAAGVRFRPAVADAEGRTIRFADGSSLDAGIVIWTTGYRSDYSWIHVPGVVGDGHVIHRRGVTDVPGLYFLGLPWQHRRGSALLGFVHEDAAYLAGRITSRAPARQTGSPNSRISPAAYSDTRSSAVRISVTAPAWS